MQTIYCRSYRSHPGNMCEISGSYTAHPDKHLPDHPDPIEPSWRNDLHQADLIVRRSTVVVDPADPIDPTRPIFCPRAVHRSHPRANVWQRTAVNRSRSRQTFVQEKLIQDHVAYTRATAAYKSRCATQTPKQANICAYQQ